MPAKIDLKGQKFGHLLVLEESNIRLSKRVTWKCICDCGNEKLVTTSDLRTGHTSSCGCAKGNKKDITQQRFGHLIALNPTSDRDSSQSVMWLCQCDCGRQIKVAASHLLSGNTTSCGCVRIQKLIEANKKRKIDLTNQKFGLLTALREMGVNNNKSILWECLCECGKLTIVSSHDLLTGNTKSCGCQRDKSFGEQKIKELLKNNNLNFETEKSFNSCKFSDTQKLARFDFYVENKYLIEYDGIQHFKMGTGIYDNFEKFEITQKHDIFKNNWCKENNIPLIRIPYTHLENLTIKDLLLETSKFINIQEEAQ